MPVIASKSYKDEFDVSLEVVIFRKYNVMLVMEELFVCVLIVLIFLSHIT